MNSNQIAGNDFCSCRMPEKIRKKEKPKKKTYNKLGKMETAEKQQLKINFWF